MGNDATEAALGLLGLTSATFDTVPTVPLKRKQSPPTSSRQQQPASTSAGSDTISCICGFTYDDGFSIGCDSCARWCHAACFGIVESQVPEEWQCWVCSPRPVDKERAIRVQKARQRTALNHEAERQRRRMSPGVDRKGRKTSGSTADGTGHGHTKRKRRTSMAATPSHEDEHVDIDEPWALSYVHTNHDIVPHDETRDRLRRVATRWRGVTSLQPSQNEPATPAILEPGEYQSSPLINLRPLPPSSFLPSISANLDPSVRPPSYAAHTVRPIPSSSMITPYTSTITPSTVYLADPLNAYAHLSMPKPFVHLIGPPLDVALDSRSTGNLGRFVRSGCRPNAVLRPVLCPRGKPHATSAPNGTHDDDDRETLTFGVFALRDLKAHEEVVLGWEWDDGSVVHQLPALIDSPHIFPPHELQHLRHQLTSMLHALSSTFTTCACGSKTRDCALARIAEFVDSQSPPTPSPSPPTPFAPDGELWGTTGERSRVRSGSSDSSVKKRTNLGPLIGAERGFRTRERVPWSGGLGGVEMVPTEPPHAEPLSPVELSHRIPELGVKSSKDRKGKSRATEFDYAQWEASTVVDRKVDEERPATPPTPPEANLPPKLRKGWIRKASDSLRAIQSPIVNERPIGVIEETSQEGTKADESMQVDGSADDPEAAAMPPPPLPPRLAALSPRSPSNIALPRSPTLPEPHDSLSPSSRFANLSLLSPVTFGPLSYFPGHALRLSTSPTPPPPTPSPPAHQDDETPEQQATAREDQTPSLAVPAQSHPQASNTEETDMHSESAPLAVSQSLAMSHVSTQSTSDKPEKSTTLSLDVTPNVPAWEAVPMDVSVDNEGKAGIPDVHDLVMSSPVIPSINVTEETTEPTAEGPAPPLEDAAPESEPAKPRTPSPPPRPPTPKVKLSLKDFAARKKKQREEASKARGRQGSTAPSDAASSLPSTPAGQQATLVDSPAVVNAPLASTGEFHAKTAAPSAPLDETPLGTAQVSPQSVSATGVPSEVPNDKLEDSQAESTEPAHAPIVDAGDQVVPARDVPSQVSLGLKLEAVESAISLEARMVNGHQPSPSNRPSDEGLRSTQLVNHSGQSTETKGEVKPPTSPRTPPRTERFRTPSFSTPTDWSPRDTMGPKTPPRPRARSPHPPPSDGAHEDGEIVSPPPVKAVPLPPRSSSPPTHPRAYYPPPRAPGEFSGPRRPFRHPTLQNTLPQDRHLPRAPRALREPLYPVASGRPPPPRGPSADRERAEWDRERDRVWVPSSRGRGRGSGWNR